MSVSEQRLDPAESVLARARQIADEVLFPQAMLVDAAEHIPAEHLDLLAEEGFYGLAGPAEWGGLGLSLPIACEVIETFGGGCLSTAFVWIQHHSTVLSIAYGHRDDLRARWLRPMCCGKIRAGIALGGIRPGPPALRARKVEGGYLFDGEVSWVTGWGMIDVLRTAARDAEDNIVFGLLDPVKSASLSVWRLDLLAGNASDTVHARFADHYVPTERIIGTMPLQEWVAKDAGGLRVNGSLALGVASRCCRMIGASGLDAELAERRRQLDDADAQTLPAARAAVSELAMRSAVTLVTATGSRSILRDANEQRLAREALFLLVFGSRQPIKQSLLQRLTAGNPPS